MFTRHEALLAEARKALYQRGFDIIKPIGGGGFATIYHVRSRQYDTAESDFAVKLIDISCDDSNALPKSFQAEIKCLTNISHPNVIKIFDHFTSETVLYIILEYCEHGSLWDLVRSEGPLRPTMLLEVSRQVISALAHIHELGIAHRDVKPSNILLDRYGRAKLADFGLAQLFTSPEQLSHAFNGSLCYLAPEVLARRPYDPMRADVWSLGVSLYELASGHLPWEAHSAEDLLEEIKTKPVLYPSHFSPGFIYSLQGMLAIDPRARAQCRNLLTLGVFKQSVRPGLSLKAINELVAKKEVAAASSLILAVRTPVKTQRMIVGKRRSSNAASRLMTRSRTVLDSEWM